jgi:hypothetical protein
MTTSYAGEILGRFVAESRWEDIAPALRQEAKRSILNNLGCGLGVAKDPAVTTALAVMRNFSGAPVATVIGQGVKLDPMAASFVNAIACNLLDYDDTHLQTVIHPTAPVAPALLALAEQRGLSGAAVLHAFLLGGEVECRIGNAVSPGHYARGWHITSTCGTFGAAAGCAKLLGLSAEQTWHAIGIAASQAAGLVENLPTAAKNVGVGNAPRNGILGALLAEQGYKAAPAAIEGPLGFAKATGDAPDLTQITGGLGTCWEIAKNTYKPYPAGIVFHAVHRCLPRPARRAERGTGGHRLRHRRGRRAAARARRPRGEQRARCAREHPPQRRARPGARPRRRRGFRDAGGDRSGARRLPRQGRGEARRSPAARRRDGHAAPHGWARVPAHGDPSRAAASSGR